MRTAINLTALAVVVCTSILQVSWAKGIAEKTRPSDSVKGASLLLRGTKGSRRLINGEHYTLELSASSNVCLTAIQDYVRMERCNGGTSQFWLFNEGLLVSVSTGQCLTDFGGTPSLSYCRGRGNQKWDYSYEEGRFKIGKKCLSRSRKAREDSSHVVEITTCNSLADVDQRFRIGTKSGDREFFLKLENDDLCVEFDDDLYAIFNDCGGNSRQEWYSELGVLKTRDAHYKNYSLTLDKADENKYIRLVDAGGEKWTYRDNDKRFHKGSLCFDHCRVGEWSCGGQGRLTARTCSRVETFDQEMKPGNLVFWGR